MDHASDAASAEYQRLRESALEPTSMGLTASAHPDVLALVLDLPAGSGVGTVSVLADGMTSACVSDGTVLSAGHYAPVSAVDLLLQRVQQQIGAFPPSTDRGLPTPDMIGVHVLTPEGHRRRDLPQVAFAEPETEPELEPILRAMQDVVRPTVDNLPSRSRPTQALGSRIVGVGLLFTTLVALFSNGFDAADVVVILLGLAVAVALTWWIRRRAG